jgi:hypothetical protein
MSAYNPDWLRNRLLRRQATRWHRQARLTDAQLAAIRTAHPVGFRDSNNAADVGLFVFTLVVVGGAVSLVVLLFDNVTALSIGFGLAIVGLNEWLIRHQRFYRNGVDNALILSASGLLSFGLLELLLNVPGMRGMPGLPALLVLLVAVWRYADPLTTGLAVLSSYYILLNPVLVRLAPAGVQAIGNSNAMVWRTALVIVWSSMGYAGTTWLTRRLRAHRLWAYYADALSLTQWLLLGAVLLAANTFGRQAFWPVLLPGASPTAWPGPEPTVAFGLTDSLLTFGVPMIFVGYGFWRKDRRVIVLGLLGLVAGVATVRYYLDGWPRSVYLSVFGAALVGLALLGIRWLRTVQFGFTDAPDDSPEPGFRLNPQTIGLVQTTTGLLPADDPKLRFGGGDFGGAGAGGTVG